MDGTSPCEHEGRLRAREWGAERECDLRQADAADAGAGAEAGANTQHASFAWRALGVVGVCVSGLAFVLRQGPRGCLRMIGMWMPAERVFGRCACPARESVVYGGDGTGLRCGPAAGLGGLPRGGGLYDIMLML